MPTKFSKSSFLFFVGFGNAFEVQWLVFWMLIECVFAWNGRFLRLLASYCGFFYKFCGSFWLFTERLLERGWNESRAKRLEEVQKWSGKRGLKSKRERSEARHRVGEKRLKMSRERYKKEVEGEREHEKRMRRVRTKESKKEPRFLQMLRCTV